MILNIIASYLAIGGVVSILVCLWAKNNGQEVSVWDFLVIMLLYGYYIVRLLIEWLNKQFD